MSVTLNKAIQNFKNGLAIDLRNSLVVKAPVDTGNLKNSIRVEINDDGIQVFMPEYAKYLEFGTGIYGPFGVPITPKTAKALRFKMNGKIVFAKKVKGMTPQPFIRPVFHKEFIKLVKKNAEMYFTDVIE